MQPVNKSMESIAFVILCGSEAKTKRLHTCLERLTVLEKENTPIENVFAYLVDVNEEASYIKKPAFKKWAAELEGVTVVPVNGNTRNATEPRAYNYGIDAMLEGPADYVVFLHDTDLILDKNLLKYYMWLFSSAHNPELVGAAAFSTSPRMREGPHKHTKMWYADDVYLRGVCIKRDALVATGPMDEMLIYRSFEWDFFSRMIHHVGYLTRLGKEPNKFIKFGGPDLTEDHKKMSILQKQSVVWIARKWHHKGRWPEETKDVSYNCYVRKNRFYLHGTNTPPAQKFFDKFVLNDDQKARLEERLKALYADSVINKTIEVTPTFVKKPLGHFTLPETFNKGVSIKDNPGIQTHVKCELEYWDDLLWEAKKVY